MTATWFRRVLLSLACATATLLAACGSSTIESALTPSRFLAVGDAFSSLGQVDQGENGSRYTVNVTDGSIMNWSEQLASRYGLTLSASSKSGRSYARAHARVSSTTDAVGGSAPSITAQVDELLAANSLGANDVVLVQGGISDIIAQMASTGTDNATKAANVKQAGRELGAQVRKLVNVGGARYVIVVGAYNLGQSRWAIETGQRDLLRDLSTAFNTGLLVAIADLGANVLYVDAALYFNLVTATPSGYGLTDVANAPDRSPAITDSEASPVACNSFDSDVGIGTGANQVNSSLCTPSTIASDVKNHDYNTTLFADRIYMTPVGQRLFGNFAFDKLRQRW